jgi:hypothetical protein
MGAWRDYSMILVDRYVVASKIEKNPLRRDLLYL